jgi:hypothetical protein
MNGMPASLRSEVKNESLPTCRETYAVRGLGASGVMGEIHAAKTGVPRQRLSSDSTATE